LENKEETMTVKKSARVFLAGVLSAVLTLGAVGSLLPTRVSAASSSEIRRQINALKEEKEDLQEKIAEVQDQYQKNENEMADLMARKNVIEQEAQLLHTQVANINQQLGAYSTLIADKQDELDTAESHYAVLNDENRTRIRAMEEEGSVSYWEVLFRASSFSDLLDRLNMVEEIAASDNRRLKELSEAASAVEMAQDELQMEKEDMEKTRQELDNTQAELDRKNEEAAALLQQLLSKADDLTALEEKFAEMDDEFLRQIAQKEKEYSAAKQAEWAAMMATYVPPTMGQAGAAGGGSVGGGEGGWLIPCNYTSVTSPFGNRNAPTAGASSNHMGVDLDSTTGERVVASKGGVVMEAGYSNSAGNYVKIDHGNGYTSVYMHLNSIDNCSAGSVVGAGQQIGTVGATGVATGDHLHFGVTKDGVYINPMELIG